MTLSGKANFIASQIAGQAGFQDPNFDVHTVVHGCDHITFRWSLPLTFALYGIDILILEKETHKIKLDYSEFNTLAAVLGIGCKLTDCPTS